MSIKLTYFPIPGRAYIARTCFGLGGVEYTDEKIAFADLAARRGEAGASPDIPMGSLPVLTLPSGKVVIESGAISRYAAKRAGLYPEDPEGALFADEILELLSSVMSKAPQGGSDEEKKVKREEFASGFLNRAFTFIAARLSSASGPFLLGDSYCVADIGIYGFVKILRSGFLDHIPVNYDETWPEFGNLVNALETDEKYSQYKL